MSQKLFVTGISTNVGKTVVSAILAEALKASYWKPVQAGDLEMSDSMKVKSLTKNVVVLEEAFKLTAPMSPHAAARIDGVELPTSLDYPAVEGNLIIEGAGGLLVPINDAGATVADWVNDWEIPVILVSKHYLGSINHTLLTIEALHYRKIPIFGIVFVGDENLETESIIAATKIPIIGRVPMTDNLTKEFVIEQSIRLSSSLQHLISQ